MRGQAVADGAKAYLLFLVRTLVFPLAWMWAMSTARRHQDDDAHGVKKVGAAIVVGIVLAVAVLGMLWAFQQDARAGMYDQLDGRLSQAVGESEYQDQLGAVAAADGQLVILNENLRAAEARGDDQNASVFQDSIDTVEQDRAKAAARARELEPNHALYGRVSSAVQAQDDARAKQLIAGASFDYEGMDGASKRAFAVKDRAVEDMNAVMNWLLYPGVVGVFFAPLAIAVGSVLGNAWEPSETVGYKPYPGKALGLFLLMGAFGVPALFFAAWGFWDMDVRSQSGQISL